MKFKANTLFIFIVLWLGIGTSAQAAPRWLNNFVQLYPQLLCNGSSPTQQCYNISRKQCVATHKKHLKWCAKKKGPQFFKSAKTKKARMALSKSLSLCAMERFKKRIQPRKMAKGPACKNVF